MRLRVLVVLVLFASIVPSAFCYPRHVDPESLKAVDPSAVELFGIYEQVFRELMEGEYEISEEWLELAGEVVVYPELMSSLMEYNQLVGLQVEDMELMDHYLDQVLVEVNNLELELAMDLYRVGYEYLELSSENLPLIVDRTDDLSGDLGHSSEGLYDVLGDLDDLIGRYQELASLIEQGLSGEEFSQHDVDRFKGLVSETFPDFPGFNQYFEDVLEHPVNSHQLEVTSLSISVSRSEVLVGRKLVVSGVLSGVPGVRGIDVYVGGWEVASVNTSTGGVFEVEFKMPYIYRDSVDVYAVFWPKGDDVTRYLPAQSNSVMVELEHYTPSISFYHPPVVYPGDVVRVQGAVRYLGRGLEDMTAYVSFGGVNYTRVTGSDGEFVVELPVGRYAEEGSHEFVVGVKPLQEFERVSFLSSVSVKRLDSSLLVDAPGWVLAGWRVPVSGVVKSGGVPVEDCNVSVYWDGGRLSGVVDGGVFRFDVPVSLFAFSPSFGYRVEALPVDDHVNPSSVYLSCRVYNVGAFLMLVGMVVGVVRLWNPEVKPRPLTLKEVVRMPEVVAVVDDGSVSVDDGSPSWAYRESIGLVRRLTGVEYRDSYTIREYLGAVRVSLGSMVFSLFEELSLAYERWLYGRPVEDLGASIRRVWDRLRRVDDEG